MKVIKGLIIGMVIGILAGLWVGVNIGSGEPWYSNPFKQRSVMDKITSSIGEGVEKAGEGIEKIGEDIKGDTKN